MARDARGRGGLKRVAKPLAALAAAVVLGIGGLPGAPAAQETEPETRPGAEAPRGTGLPLPRFASLRAGEVYMRTGPGTRYPIEWIYRRRGLPVQIVAEFDAWRKVQDPQGTVGWVHRAMLAGRRTAVVIADGTMLLRNPAPDAPAVARAEVGVMAEILSCEGAWCRIEARGLRGWIPRAALWGTFPGEKVN